MSVVLLPIIKDKKAMISSIDNYRPVAIASVNLKKCPTGCIAGGTVVNHLMYADDIVLLSPSATGLSLLLHVCGKYGLDHDISFNSKKSAVIIFRNSSVKDFSFPSFEMNGESIKEVPFVKYLGHVISADMKDDLDIMRQCRQYMHKAMLLLVVFICARIT